MELKDARYFVSAGYEIMPGQNGGFLLTTGRQWSDRGNLSQIAAFTNYVDLLDYLKDGHAAVDQQRLMSLQLQAAKGAV